MMDGELGEALSALKHDMRFRVARAAVLAGNIANADTPGYRRRELHFEDLLGAEIAGLRLTDSRHIGLGGPEAGGRYRLEMGARGERPDGNGVNLDSEILKVHRNAAAFGNSATMVARVGSLIRTAIGAG